LIAAHHPIMMLNIPLDQKCESAPGHSVWGLYIPTHEG
jgi:hypothetical protein